MQKRAYSLLLSSNNSFSWKFNFIQMSSTSSSSALSTADIVGIAIGGFLGLTTIVGIIFSVYTMCCKKNNNAQVWAQPAPHQPPNGPYGQPMNTGYYQQPPSYNRPPINYEQPPAYSAVYQGDNRYGKHWIYQVMNFKSKWKFCNDCRAFLFSI